MSFIKSWSLAAIFALQVASVPVSRRDLSCPAANGTTYTQGSSSWTIECGIDRFQGDMPAPNGQYAESLEACIEQCTGREGCVLVDYVVGAKACYVKNTVGYSLAKEDVIGALLTTPSTENTPPTQSAPPSTGSNLVVSDPEPVYPPSNGGSASKRGLCYNNAAFTNFFGGSGSKVTWSYDWAQTTGSGANPNLVYSPMLWGGAPDRVASWAANAAKAIANGAEAVLGFNEPDLHEQANMGVGAAVSLWKSAIQPLAGKVKLISPAVTNGPTPMGLAYLKSFINSCDGCTIDGCAIHWYDSATNVAYFKNYIADAYAACGNRPLWLTEFGASGSESQVQTFLKDVLPWMDNNDMVAKYAYFMAAASSDGKFLINGAGTGLSAIGELYNSA